MEKTLAEIDADIADLSASVGKYRKLAEERQAIGHLQGAHNLMALVAEFETKLAAALEAKAKAR
jgi:hypothetical protein